MNIYYVIEYLTNRNYEENASGFYSSLEKAQQAILDRVAEVYTEEEMKAFHFSEDGCIYTTTENDYTEDCTYIIYENKMDERMG